MRSFRSTLMSIALVCMAVVAIAASAGQPYEQNDSALITVPLAIPDNSNAAVAVYSSSEMRCVQRAVFGEARNLSYAAQVAVAASIVSRSRSGTFPYNLCDVTKQANQYQGYSGGVSLSNDIEAAAWDTAEAAADRAVYRYDTLPVQYQQTFYFSNASSRAPGRGYPVLGKLGSLVFYGSKSG